MYADVDKNTTAIAVVYMWNKIISKLFQPSSRSVWNNFISARGNLPEIILKLIQKLIAAHKYFSTWSTRLKLWNSELKLFQPLKEFWNYVKIISATLNMLERIRELQ